MEAPSSDPAGRAIVLFARSWQALTCVRSLGRRGVEVVTGDEFALTPGNLSRYSVANFQYPNPLAEPERFFRCIEEAVDSFKPQNDIPYVLLPVQLETELIAQSAHRFGNKISVAAPPAKLVSKVSDKGWLAEFAAKQGVAVPTTWQPKNVVELEALAQDIQCPVIVKIRSGIGGSGLIYCDHWEAVRSAFEQLVTDHNLDENHAPIIQQAVYGKDYCVSAIAHQGHASGVMTYKNIQKLSSGGPGMLRQTVSAPGAELQSCQLLSALDWHGIAQLDYVWDGEADSAAYLIEINARLFAGLFQAVASGIDYPWLLFEQAAHEKAPNPDSAEVGVITETPILGLVSTLRELGEALTPGDALSVAWSSAKTAFGEDGVQAAMQSWLEDLQVETALEERQRVVENLLERREQIVDQLLVADDPMAGLGVLYPLAVFFKYGRVSKDLLMGLEAP